MKGGFQLKKIPHTGDTNSLTNAGSRTDTNLKRLRDLSNFLFFWLHGCMVARLHDLFKKKLKK